MEGVKQLHVCFPILLILVFYIPDSVMGEIGVNCGSGAVVGQPYTMECTNLPDTVNNGINVFLGDEDNSIINCYKSKGCFSQYTSLYSVMTPHNESLFFTILNVTTDDIGKKLYCVDGNTLSTSDPSCPLALVPTTAVPETSTSTRITDEQTNPAATTTSMEVTDGGNGLSVGEKVGISVGVIAGSGVCIGTAIVIKKKFF